MKLHKKSFNSINRSRNKNNINVNSLSYSTLYPNYSIKDKKIYTDNINNNIYKNSYSFLKDKQPNFTLFSNYMSRNIRNNISKQKLNNLTNNNINISNSSIPNGFNQTYNEDINLMTMKLNFRILEQKITNLSNLLLPKKTIYNSNYSLNKKYNNINSSFSPNIKFEKYFNKNNYLKNDLTYNTYNLNYEKNNISNSSNIILKKNNIKNKFNYLNNNYFKLIKNNNNEVNNKMNKTEENYENDKNILNKSINLDLEKLSKKESENLSDDELSNLANELVSSLREKKENLEEEEKLVIDNNIIENNNNNKIIKKKTKINNNYIITNISGTVNYTPASQEPIISKNEEDNIPKNINKNDFTIIKNSFCINSEPKRKMLKTSEKENNREKEENQNNKIEKDIKIIEQNDSLLNKKNKNYQKEMDILKDIQDDINKKKEIEQNKNNSESDLDILLTDKNDDNNIDKDFVINQNKDYKISRNKLVFKEENGLNNNNIENKKEKYNKKPNQKKVTIENSLIYINYNDKEKPTKINLYKAKSKADAGIKLHFRPKNINLILNNLIQEKKLKSILLNKNDINIVRRGLDDKPFCSMDDSEKIKKIKKIKINQKNKNILKRNIDYIKKVEEKNKNMEKNIMSENKYLIKGKNKNSSKNKKRSNSRILKKENDINKVINTNISQNNNSSDYIKIDVIQEEEEVNEESKYEKKIDKNF